MATVKYYEVAPTAIVRTGSRSFTYHSEEDLAYGRIVDIEVGSKKLQGVIIEHVTKPSYATKPISQATPYALPKPSLETALWMSEYYATPLATVLQSFLPRGFKKNRRKHDTQSLTITRDRTKIVFNNEQCEAIDTITSLHKGTVLLHGVTGSGKTHVYIELVKRTLQSGKSAIILVPEIALTSQVVDDFSQHFEDIIITHSNQTEAQRHLAWIKCHDSTRPSVVIGPRSALLMPLKNIGLVVIDECHEPSFKQEQSPRYSALRVASKLTALSNSLLILGSATPTIADYYLAHHSKNPIIRMAKKGREEAVDPAITLVDMTQRSQFRRHRFLSDTLIEHIEQTFQSNQQVLIFHNRRGSASTTLCENCGWSAGCPRCFVPLTLHTDLHELRCHICGLREPIPTSCPSCCQTDIIHKGIGTKLIEMELKKLFPNKNIARFDGDNDAASTVEQRYKELYDGTINIILGTQVIAKGLDLPQLRTVGVIQADSGLSLPDYSSSERTFQLLAQVVGRVGRSHHPTNVIVQSYQPTHPAVVDGLAQNYEHFYKTTLTTRQQSHFPPFSFLLKLTCIYKTESTAIRNAKILAQTLRLNLPSEVLILGPTPSFYERQHDTYRWQLVLKSSKRSLLVDALKHLPPNHWQFELDPISLL